MLRFMQHSSLVGYHPSNVNPDTYETGLLWPEVRWHRARFVEFIGWIYDKYGKHVPLMIRTRHIRDKNNNGGKIRVFQLDQSNRAVAKEFGLPLFTWGDKIEGWVK